MSNILKISDAGSLALHAMTMVAEGKGDLVPMKNIAKKFKISQNHLSKVLQRLVKANLIKSVKGKGGGFKLTKNPKQISYLDIYEAIDGKFEPTNCLLNKKRTCPKCIMSNFIRDTNKQAEAFFLKTKLSDFVE